MAVCQTQRKAGYTSDMGELLFLGLGLWVWPQREMNKSKVPPVQSGSTASIKFPENPPGAVTMEHKHCICWVLVASLNSLKFHGGEQRLPCQLSSLFVFNTQKWWKVYLLQTKERESIYSHKTYLLIDKYINWKSRFNLARGAPSAHFQCMRNAGINQT